MSFRDIGSILNKADERREQNNNNNDIENKNQEQEQLQQAAVISIYTSLQAVF